MLCPTALTEATIGVLEPSFLLRNTIFGAGMICRASGWGRTCIPRPEASPLPALQAEGHMREAARCMAEAQAVRAAGLAREEALAAEVRSLRQQLAGQLGEDDPAKAMQVRGRRSA